MTLRKVFMTAITAAACALLASQVFASPSAAKKLVVVVANRLTLADLADPSLKAISRMLGGGSAASISPNCPGAKKEESVMLTAAAGSGCRGLDDMHLCFDAGEKADDGMPAADSYFARTDFKAPSGSAVFLATGPTTRLNVMEGRTVDLGSCADALHQAGRKTAAIGNADIWPGIRDRAAAVLAADSHGLIDVGMLSAGASTKDKYGLRADVPALVSAIDRALAKADYVVVNFGATTALDNSRTEISDKSYNINKQAAMRDLDALVGSLMTRAESREFRLILLSLSPPAQAAWTKLPPMVVYPSIGSGLLASPTTRTPGLIAASDFAPTAIELLGATPVSEMEGRPAFMAAGNKSSSERRSPDKLRLLEDLDSRVSANHDLIWPMLMDVRAHRHYIVCTGRRFDRAASKGPLGAVMDG